jgi:3-oxoacyl-[acyl-carrier-protein] synthase III
MGTIIESSYASPDGPQSSIGMAVFAVQNCLNQAGMHVQDIGLLINIGVFRDNNIVEPAMAPLIQQQLGMNLDPVKNDHIHRATFSFDINDGECGFLTAASVADGFLKSGSAKYALIVAGDIHPSKSDHPDFPFRSVATAILLAYSEDAERGFSAFHFKTSGNGHIGFSANVDLSRNGDSGRERMEFITVETYHDQLFELTAGMMNELILSGAIHPADVDYLVTSHHRKGFGDQIARSLRMNGSSRVIDLYERYGNTHTSALSVCYHRLVSDGLLKNNDRILFIGAGSGMSAACSLYRV